jgi:hypothetical protein
MHRAFLNLAAAAALAIGLLALSSDNASSQPDPFKPDPCEGKPHVCSSPNASCCGRNGCWVDQSTGECRSW